MSYDLHARNKEIESIRFGAFSWPQMVKDTGMGYILNCGEGKFFAEYVYAKGNNGSPLSNDGYKVSSSEAKMMAKIARGYVFVKKFINQKWDELSENERKTDLEVKGHDGLPLYNKPINEEFLKSLEKFADFAEKSNGFRIT